MNDRRLYFGFATYKPPRSQDTDTHLHTPPLTLTWPVKSQNLGSLGNNKSALGWPERTTDVGLCLVVGNSPPKALPLLSGMPGMASKLHCRQLHDRIIDPPGQARCGNPEEMLVFVWLEGGNTAAALEPWCVSKPDLLGCGRADFSLIDRACLDLTRQSPTSGFMTCHSVYDDMFTALWMLTLPRTNDHWVVSPNCLSSPSVRPPWSITVPSLWIL
jgi:hypothetical protein